MSTVLGASLVSFRSAFPDPIRTVFVIAMENHNWTQPSGQTSPNPIRGNAAAPFINSLVTPGNPSAAQVSYASNYQHVGTGIHPSEPNYLWSEGGTNYGIFNDNDPFPSNVQSTTRHLCGYFQSLGIDWRSYQEDTDLARNGSGQLTGTPLSPGQYTVPLVSFSGTSPAYINPYNGRTQYNYAAKHNPPLYFLDTNGGNDQTSANPLAPHYAPLQALQTDLNNGTVAPFNWITPNQYNDMHSVLSGGFTYHGTTWTGDQASIAQGDNFLAIVVPMIMASSAYQNNGVIVIWNDETEGGDDPSRTIMEIVISPLARGNAYTNAIRYTHSSDLRTWQQVFGVGPLSGIGDAQNATDLSDLFLPGSCGPTRIGPSTYSLSRGVVVSGSLASLTDRDQAYFQAHQGFLLDSAEPQVRIVLNAVSTLAVPGRLAFDLVSHAPKGTVQMIELYDWTSGSYVLLDTRVSTTGDSLLEVEAPKPYRFVQNATRALRARVSFLSTEGGLQPPFVPSVDQTIWKVSP